MDQGKINSKMRPGMAHILKKPDLHITSASFHLKIRKYSFETIDVATGDFLVLLFD